MAPVNTLWQLTGLLADGTWVPVAMVHFIVVAATLLAGWMAVRAKDYAFQIELTRQSLVTRKAFYRAR